MKRKPPSELDGAEVFMFAPVGTAHRPTGATVHSVTDFASVVCGLALARYQENEVYLFYCDEEWTVVSDTWHANVEDAIDQAQFEFEGLEFEPLTPSGEQMAGLAREAVAVTESALRDAGFVKRHGVLLQRRDGGASGFVGLNTATFALPQEYVITPIIGVCFTRFDELLRELWDGIPRNANPVISTALGYVMPENMFKSWDFPLGGDLAAVAGSLVDAVREHGRPYFDRYTDWDTVSGAVKADPHLVHAPNRVQYLTVIHALDGDLARASEVIETAVAEMGARDDMYAVSIQAFAARFRERVQSS